MPKLLLAIEAGLAVFLAFAFFKIVLTPRPAFACERGLRTRLVWVNESGHVRRSVEIAGRYGSPRLGSDGSVLLDRVEPGGTEVWRFRPEDRSLRKQVSGQRSTMFGVLSPDRREMVWTGWVDNMPRLFVRSGMAPARKLGADKMRGFCGDWSPDGRWIAYTQMKEFRVELWLMEASSGRAQMLTGAEALSEPRFSPDGKRLAFAATIGGREEIYAGWVPGAVHSGAPPEFRYKKLSTGGGHSPRWGSDEILYYEDDALNLKRVRAGRTEELFAVQALAGAGFDYRFDGFDVDARNDSLLFALAGAS